MPTDLSFGALAFWRRLLRTRAGNVAAIAAVATPAILGLVGMGADFAMATGQKRILQNAADAAALASARELSLRSTDASTISATVGAYLTSAMQGQTVRYSARILDNREGVEVRASAHINSLMGGIFGRDLESGVLSVARLSAATPLCMLGLSSSENGTIGLDKDARVTANGCAVVSNSSKPNGLMSKNSAVLRASAICTAGGKAGGPGNFYPEPTTDCPAIPDPLADRPAPAVGICTAQATNLSAGAANLVPGVYCGGMVIGAGAVVTLAPGIYVIKGGPLHVKDGGLLQGKYVTFQFVDDEAGLKFDAGSSIDLGAAKDGPLAGFLFFAEKGGGGRKVSINSNDARNLLGTIYFPTDEFIVGGTSPIADKSDFTVIVARKMTFSAGPEFVLNSDYEGSDVPVPDGVGPQDRHPYLSQ